MRKIKQISNIVASFTVRC